MRLSDLFEAPIADFQYLDHGDGDSFRDDDRRAITSPKWQAKLVNMFRNTVEPVNLYIANQKFLTTYQNPWPNSEHADKQVVVTPRLQTDSMQEWAGTYNAHEFQKTFGFLPPNYQAAINVVLTQNEGDERLPLTPWMVGHRIIHAIATRRTKMGSNTPAREHMTSAFILMQEVMAAVRRDSYLEDAEMWARISTLTSARTRKIERGGEFIVELFTQFYLKGDFDLDLTEVMPDYEETNVMDTISEVKRSLSDSFAAAVGEMFVF